MVNRIITVQKRKYRKERKIIEVQQKKKRN